MTFEDLQLAPAILKAVSEQGYETPTPIQAQAIPAVLAGQDLLAGAQTGTGKTAAFTLPMLHKLSKGQGKTNKFGKDGIAALVLTPTRELAAQVEESIRTYGKYLPLSSTVIFGGVGMNPQIDRIKKGVDILVATPGRLLDLQQQGHLDLSTVEILVLDEADRMLDMGFLPDVKKILALVPKDKQSLLFSATFSDDIRELAHTLLKNPQSIQVTPRNTTVQRITQVMHPVGREKKKQLLAHGWQYTAVYAVYSVPLMIGRFSGDKLTDRFGGVLIARVAAVCAVLGFLLVCVAPDAWAALAGFAVVGLGISVMAPLTFAAAGRLDPHETGIAVARLNVFNYVGFLLGAPLLTSLWQAGMPYRPGWLIPATLAALMFVFAYGFNERRTAAG